MADIELEHPDLPGRTIVVPEEKVWVYGESGWVRTDGEEMPDGPTAAPVEEAAPVEVVEYKEFLGPDIDVPDDGEEEE